MIYASAGGHHRSCGGPLRKDGASHAAGAGQPRGYACIYHESIASPTAPYRRGDREKRGRSRLLFIDWRGGEAGKIIKAFNASDLSAQPDEQGPKNQRRPRNASKTHTHTFRRRWFLGFSFCIRTTRNAEPVVEPTVVQRVAVACVVVFSRNAAARSALAVAARPPTYTVVLALF